MYICMHKNGLFGVLVKGLFLKAKFSSGFACGRSDDLRRKKKDPERCDERCELCKNRFSCRKRALLGFERLAFGSTADAFRLLMYDGEAPLDVGALDLFNVAEIKKPKDGAMELKFFDRLKALEQLGNIPEGDNAAAAFYEAISSAAKAQRGGEE